MKRDILSMCGWRHSIRAFRRVSRGPVKIQRFKAGLLLAAAISACEEGPPPDPAHARMRMKTEALREQISASPDSQRLHYRLGMVFAEFGYLDSACIALERCLLIDSAIPEVHFELGDLYLQQNKVDAAAAAYEQAVRYKPDWVDAFNNLGFVYKKAGRLDLAESAYERALLLDSSFVQAYNNLGQVYKQRGEWSEAIRLYQKAIAARPMFQEAYLNLAMAYKSNGDYDKETEILQDIVELFGTAEKWGAYAESRLAELQAFGGSSTL